LEPDVILTVGGNTAKALQQATHSVPIVFVTVIDPVGRGLVASLARPGGNATGFMSFEYAVSGKWLELLKQIAPHVRRAAVLRDPTTVTGGGMLGGIQAVAPSLGGLERSSLHLPVFASSLHEEIEPLVAGRTVLLLRRSVVGSIEQR
jgi:putative ABC transport system substrate-binding protein